MSGVEWGIEWKKNTAKDPPSGNPDGGSFTTGGLRCHIASANMALYKHGKGSSRDFKVEASWIQLTTFPFCRECYFILFQNRSNRITSEF